MTHEQILTQLKTQGHRITKSRRGIIDILLNTSYPLSVPELQTALQKKDLTVNKTTVYREVEFLLSQHLIDEIQFGGETLKRYEWALGAHHHHVQCVHCGKIVDIDLPEELKQTSARIKRSTGFQVLGHSLEFVGVCPDCQKKQ